MSKSGSSTAASSAPGSSNSLKPSKLAASSSPSSPWTPRKSSRQSYISRTAQSSQPTSPDGAPILKSGALGSQSTSPGLWSVLQNQDAAGGDDNDGTIMGTTSNNNHNPNTSTYLSDSDYEGSSNREPPIRHSTINLNHSPTTDGDPSSAEHTPTTFSHRQHLDTSTGLIADWSSSDCADYVSSLGLPQYADMLIGEAINGEALVEMHHQDLKDIGISSLGHRLTILKGVYELKMSQNVPIDPDHYIPLSADGNSADMSATQDDIARVIESIRLRDQRILSAESELRAMKDDLNRILDENRKLREETLPLIRLAKDKSHPLPNPEAPLTTPPPDLKSMQIGGSGLSRKFSTKRLFLGSAPKNTSPTTLGEGTSEPGSAALSGSHGLLSTAGNTLQNSPATSQNNQHSPTSPAYANSIASSTLNPRFGGPLSSRDDTSYYGMSATYHPTASGLNHSNSLLGRRDIEPPLGSAPLPTSANSMSSNMMSGNSGNNPNNSTSRERERERERDRDRRTANPSNQQQSGVGGSGGSGGSNTTTSNNNSGGGGSSAADDNIEIFKSFRVSIQDPCREVLPVALKRYNINEDWRQYALYIVHGDQERCLGLDEKPLMLFKQLDREGRKPMFMLRKHASPAVGWSSENGSANKTMSRDLPGGVL